LFLGADPDKGSFYGAKAQSPPEPQPPEALHCSWQTLPTSVPYAPKNLPVSANAVSVKLDCRQVVVLCVCLLQKSMNLLSLAEETYCQLSDDVTCRASALRSLVMTSCSSDVILLLTALCSQLLHLQLIDCTQVGLGYSRP